MNALLLRRSADVPRAALGEMSPATTWTLQIPLHSEPGALPCWPPRSNCFQNYSRSMDTHLSFEEVLKACRNSSRVFIKTPNSKEATITLDCSSENKPNGSSNSTSVLDLHCDPYLASTGKCTPPQRGVIKIIKFIAGPMTKHFWIPFAAICKQLLSIRRRNWHTC